MKTPRKILAAALALTIPMTAAAAGGQWTVPSAKSVLGSAAGGGREKVPSIGPGAAVITSPDSRLSYFDTLSRHVIRNYPQIPQPAVLKVFAYLKAHNIQNRRYATIIDFDKPSNEKRMYIIRLGDGQVETFLVSHGKNSGDRYAARFSNTPQSLMSSLGLYLTVGEYHGKHGRSMKLRGMERTNSNALQRAIVLHGAKYVSEAAARGGRIGRSWGCPAVDMKHKERVIDMLKGGSVFLIHHS